MVSMYFVHFHKHKTNKNNIITVVVIVILSYMVTNTFIDHVLDKMLLFNIPIAALAFNLLYGFYGSKPNLLGAILSTIVGVVSALCCYLIFNQEDFGFLLGFYMYTFEFCSRVFAYNYKNYFEELE